MKKRSRITKYVHVHVVVIREFFIFHIAIRRQGYSAGVRHSGRWIVGDKLMVLHALDRACRDRGINL